jgi:MFS family permease
LERITAKVSDENLELQNESVTENETEENSLKVEPKQKKLFWLISTGSNSSQLILLNFFQYFAANIVTQGVLGYVTAIRNLLTALFQETFGRLSDKRGRKVLLIIGFFLSFAATILLAFSFNSQTMLIIVTTFHAFSFSISIPVWNATLGDVTETKGRSTFIGKLTAIGQGVGVLLLLLLTGVFYVIEKYGGYNVYLSLFKRYLFIPVLEFQVLYGIVFAVSAFCLLLSAVGVLFLIETKQPDVNLKPPRMLNAFKNKPFRNFIIVNSVYGVTMAALWPIYPVIQVKELSMDMYELAMVSVVYAVCFLISGYFGGKLGDKFGRKPILFFSRFILFTVSLLYIPAVIYDSVIFVVLTNTVSGLCNGAFFIIMNSYALDLASEETKGSYSGLAQVSWGVSTFIGSFVMGFISQFLTQRFDQYTMIIATTIAIGVLRIIAALGYLFVKESLPKEKRIMSS